MRHGKKPTAAQRGLMQDAGLNWREWLVIISLPREMVIRHRVSGETLVLNKDGTEAGNREGKGREFGAFTHLPRSVLQDA